MTQYELDQYFLTHVKNGRFLEAQAYLNAGANINAGRDGERAIDDAIMKNDLKYIKFLNDNGAQIKPEHLGCAKSPEVVTYLVKNALINPNSIIYNKNDKVSYPVLFYMLKNSPIEAIEQLLKYNVGTNFVSDNKLDAMKVLDKAKREDDEDLRKLLLAYGFKTEDRVYTHVYGARVYYDDYMCVKLFGYPDKLKDKNSDVDVFEQKSKTSRLGRVLMLQLKGGYDRDEIFIAASSLLRSGANPNIGGSYEVLDVDDEYEYSVSTYPLFSALHCRDTRLTKLLLEKGANPNIKGYDIKDNFVTLIDDAISLHEFNIIKLYIEHGVELGNRANIIYEKIENSLQYHQLSLSKETDENRKAYDQKKINDALSLKNYLDEITQNSERQ